MSDKIKNFARLWLLSKWQSGNPHPSWRKRFWEYKKSGFTTVSIQFVLYCSFYSTLWSNASVEVKTIFKYVLTCFSGARIGLIDAQEWVSTIFWPTPFKLQLNTQTGFFTNQNVTCLKCFRIRFWFRGDFGCTSLTPKYSLNCRVSMFEFLPEIETVFEHQGLDFRFKKKGAKVLVTLPFYITVTIYAEH